MARSPGQIQPCWKWYQGDALGACDEYYADYKGEDYACDENAACDQVASSIARSQIFLWLGMLSSISAFTCNILRDVAGIFYYCLFALVCLVC